MSPPVSIRWAELLADAVSRPGQILEAYSLFHGYSLGNQLAAMFQCRERRLAPGPIATLQRWNELKRRYWSSSPWVKNSAIIAKNSRPPNIYSI